MRRPIALHHAARSRRQAEVIVPAHGASDIAWRPTGELAAIGNGLATLDLETGAFGDRRRLALGLFDEPITGARDGVHAVRRTVTVFVVGRLRSFSVRAVHRRLRDDRRRPARTPDAEHAGHWRARDAFRGERVGKPRWLGEHLRGVGAVQRS